MEATEYTTAENHISEIKKTEKKHETYSVTIILWFLDAISPKYQTYHIKYFNLLSFLAKAFFFAASYCFFISSSEILIKFFAMRRLAIGVNFSIKGTLMKI